MFIGIIGTWNTIFKYMHKYMLIVYGELYNMMKC